MSQSLSLTHTETLQRLAAVMGIDRGASGTFQWDTATQADVRGVVRSGLRQFYHPIDPRDGAAYQWNFLKKRFTSQQQDEYSTGTVAVASGTVTLTSGTFPSWAANGLLRVSGNVLFVDSRDGDTTLTVSNTGVAVSAGASYTLNQWRVDLPSDFGELVGPVQHIEADWNRDLRIVQEGEIVLRYAEDITTPQNTIMAAVQKVSNLTEADEGYKLLYWPQLATDAILTGLYRANPLDRLDNSDIFASGTIVQADAIHAETLLASILAAGEAYYNDAPGVHSARFRDLLQISINNDRRAGGPIQIGRTRKGERWHLSDHVVVTYETI